MTDQPYARRRVGVVLAAAPHVLILALMILALADAEERNQSYAGFVGILELFVIPAGLLAALAARFIPPIRHWALPVAAVTVVGGLSVIATAVVIAGVTG